MISSEELSSINLLEKIKQIIAENLYNVRASAILPQDNLVSDLGASRKQVNSILTAVMKKFKVQITDADKEDLTTVLEINDFIRDKKILGIVSKVMVKEIDFLMKDGKKPKPEEIVAEDCFEDLNMCPIDIEELKLILEDELDIDIPEEEMEKWKTVGDVVETIKKIIP